MNLVEEIKQLLDDGNYLEAHKLAGENKLTYCNICQDLDISDVESSIGHSLDVVKTLEEKINEYTSDFHNVKDIVLQMEEEERALAIRRRNLSKTCDLIKELLDNLHIDDHVQNTLSMCNLDDESSSEPVAEAISQLRRVLEYEPKPDLQQMRCVAVQQNNAKYIRSIYEARSNSFKATKIKSKRDFDKSMEQRIAAIRESKAPKQSKCGVLSVVEEFENTVKEVEARYESLELRRSDIDRWYRELVVELFGAIDRMEHSRTPTEMIRLENYNYLHGILRTIKMPCLEDKKKEAKLQYEIALKAYVACYFGRPLEKLNIFFEGVQAKVAQGVKEEEISFQLAFNKYELRKVLQMVTLKEVRKGLEEMYRRIEKHASEPDSNLIQVIWHEMQQEFLSQYKAIQGMIERCYPSTNLSLSFSIDDVLRVFSDIAQSH